MGLNRKYFLSFLVIILFSIIINSCSESDPNKNNIKELTSSGSTNKSLSTKLEDETKIDTFYFNIHPDLPDFKFIIKIGEFSVVEEIQIYNSTDTIPTQIITTDIINQRSPENGEYFTTQDFNFDGYKDIELLEDYSGTGNISYCVWLYNKSKSIFETDDLFKSIERPILDEKKKRITTYLEYGGFDEKYETTYQLKNGKFILLYELKYWRDYKGDNYLQMKDSSIGYGDTLKLISRKKYGP